MTDEYVNKFDTWVQKVEKEGNHEFLFIAPQHCAYGISLPVLEDELVF